MNIDPLGTSQCFYTASIIFTANAGADSNMNTAITTALRTAGVDVFEPVMGEKLWRLTEDIVNRDRVIVIVSKDALADPRVCNMVNKVKKREFDAGACAFMIPVAIDGALRALDRNDPRRRDAMSVLCDRVAVVLDEKSEPFDKTMKRILRALEK